MKSHALLPLVLALSVALFATACARDTDDTLDQAGVVPEPGLVDPEPVTTTPEPATDPVDSGMTFDQMDTNGDGGITPDELDEAEMLHAHFSVADTDGDGRLTAEEVEAHRAAMAASPTS